MIHIFEDGASIITESRRSEHVEHVPLADLLADKTQRCPDCGEVFLRETDALAVHLGNQTTDCGTEPT